MKALEQAVLGILRRHLAAEPSDDPLPLEPETPLERLGISSLNVIRLVVELEKTFGFEFDDDRLDLGSFETVAGLVHYVELHATRREEDMS